MNRRSTHSPSRKHWINELITYCTPEKIIFNVKKSPKSFEKNWGSFLEHLPSLIANLLQGCTLFLDFWILFSYYINNLAKWIISDLRVLSLSLLLVLLLLKKNYVCNVLYTIYVLFHIISENKTILKNERNWKSPLSRVSTRRLPEIWQMKWDQTVHHWMETDQIWRNTSWRHLNSLISMIKKR